MKPRPYSKSAALIRRLSGASRQTCALSLVFLATLMPLCNMEQRGKSGDVARLDRLVSSGDLETFIDTARTTPLYKASRNELMYNLDAGLAEVFTGSYRNGVCPRKRQWQRFPKPLRLAL